MWLWTAGRDFYFAILDQIWAPHLSSVKKKKKKTEAWMEKIPVLVYSALFYLFESGFTKKKTLNMSNYIFWCEKETINDMILLEEHKIITGQSGVMTIKLFPSPLCYCWKYFIWIFKLILTTSFQVKPKIKLAWPTWI